jgi:hypothetical protein
MRRQLHVMSSPHSAVPDSPAPDPVAAWRTELLTEAGIPEELALRIGRDCAYDLHAVLVLTDRGCPAGLALRILAPLDEPRPPW